MARRKTIKISDVVSKDVFNRLLNLKIHIKWNFNTTKARDKVTYVFNRFMYGCTQEINDVAIDVIEHAYKKHVGFQRSPYTLFKYRQQGIPISDGMIKTGNTLAHLKLLREQVGGREAWFTTEEWMSKGISKSHTLYAAAGKSTKVGTMANNRIQISGISEFYMMGYPLKSGKPIEANIYLQLLKKRWMGRVWREAMKGYRYYNLPQKRYGRGEGSWKPEADLGGKKYRGGVSSLNKEYSKKIFKQTVKLAETPEERMKQQLAYNEARISEYQLKTEELLYLQLQSEKREKKRLKREKSEK